MRISTEYSTSVHEHSWRSNAKVIDVDGNSSTKKIHAKRSTNFAFLIVVNTTEDKILVESYIEKHKSIPGFQSYLGNDSHPLSSPYTVIAYSNRKVMDSHNKIVLACVSDNGTQYNVGASIFTFGLLQTLYEQFSHTISLSGNKAKELSERNPNWEKGAESVIATALKKLTETYIKIEESVDVICPDHICTDPGERRAESGNDPYFCKSMLRLNSDSIRTFLSNKDEDIYVPDAIKSHSSFMAKRTAVIDSGKMEYHKGSTVRRTKSEDKDSNHEHDMEP